MTLLATGLSGFVGSYCAQQLQALDLLFDHRPADLRRSEEVLAAIDAARPDMVIHLAAQSSVVAAIEDPAGTYEVNFGGTLNLLQALKGTGFRGRMLYVGSADVYGMVPEDELPVTEGQPLKPLNPYSVSKLAAEALCYQWSQSGPFEIVMARPFNHIGPGQGARFAVASFARQIAACRAGRAAGPLVVGDIDVTRDFSDVRDIVRAYGMLLAKGRNGEAYNVCSGVERSLRQIIRSLLDASEIDLEIEVDPRRLRALEQRRMRGSFEKLHARCGWQPEVPFEQTLKDTLDYWERKDST